MIHSPTVCPHCELPPPLARRGKSCFWEYSIKFIIWYIILYLSISSISVSGIIIIKGLFIKLSKLLSKLIDILSIVFTNSDNLIYAIIPNLLILSI